MGAVQGQGEGDGGGPAERPVAARPPVGDLRVLAHPLRLRILSLLTGAEMSAAEVAAELSTTHANASYHLRRLHRAGELEVASEVVVRGGRAKRYRHTASFEEPRPVDAGDGGTPANPVSVEHSTMVAGLLASELRRRIGERAPDTRMSFTDAELWVRPEVWTEVNTLIDRASTLLHRSALPPRTPGTVRTSTTTVTFRMTGQADRPDPADSTEEQKGES